MRNARWPVKRIFSYEEALETFPTVRDLTVDAARKVEALLRTAGFGGDPEDEPGGGPTGADVGRGEVEQACARIVDAWAREVASLGCEVKGAWLVDWDCGDGYYCWQFPEETLAHFHTYEDGFAGRMPIN